MLKKKKANQLTPPREIIPTLSVAVNQLLMRTLRANPDERPATCGEFLADLEAAGQALVAEAKQPAQVAPDNRRAETRFQTWLQGSCAMLMNPCKDSWRGRVVDISAGGAHLVVNRRFETGTLLAVDVDDEQ